jgi:2-epi-5-epi-valiolone synthase
MYRMQCERLQGYEVLLSHDVLDPSNRSLAEAIASRPALVVTDSTVDELFGDRLRSYLSTVDARVGVYVADLTERTKTMSTVLDVCAAAQRHGLGRRDPLIALGGGICSDVVSVASSLIRRGIPYVCVPTTLVAQVDAGIGLKGAVNFGGSKNYLGCFAPPSRVLVDPTFLRTVPADELRAGLAEIVKVALLLDEQLFERLTADGAELTGSGFTSPAGGGEVILVRAIELMLDQLASNCYEERFERLVDFGHTFSSRLEELSNHRLRHGEAVAIDIALTCVLGAELGLLSEGDFETILATLRRLGLPVHSPLCTVQAALEAISATVRHRDGALNLVVPTGIGSATFIRTPGEIPRRALRAALERLEAAADVVVLPTAGRPGWSSDWI